MSAAKWLGILAFVGALAFGFQYRWSFASERYARQAAYKHLVSFLQRSGKPPEKLSSFQPTDFGGARWAFEAIYDNETRYGVWIARNGHFEIYSEALAAPIP